MLGRDEFQCYVDGVQRQDGALTDLLFSPARVLAAVSRVMTLEPGHRILGHPGGRGPLVDGTAVVRLVDKTGHQLISSPTRWSEKRRANTVGSPIRRLHRSESSVHHSEKSRRKPPCESEPPGKPVHLV